MNAEERAKLAKRYQYHKDTANTAFQENEKALSAVQELKQDIEVIKDDSVKIVEAINELAQSIETKIDNKVASIPPIKGDRGFKGEKGDIGPVGPAGRDGKDGESIIGPIGPAGKDGRDGKDGKDGSPDTGENIIDKVNLDKSKKKIKKEKVEGLTDELSGLSNQIQLVANRPIQGVGGGASGIRDIRAGSNVSVSKVNDVYTISSTAVSTDELVKLSASDPTAGYLDAKLVESNTVLLLDQTTPQTISNGAPTFAGGLKISDDQTISWNAGKGYTKYDTGIGALHTDLDTSLTGFNKPKWTIEGKLSPNWLVLNANNSTYPPIQGFGDTTTGINFNEIDGSIEFINESVVTARFWNVDAPTYPNTQLEIVEDGAVGTPSLFLAGDYTTGIYRPSADVLGFSSGGAEKLRIGTTGVKISHLTSNGFVKTSSGDGTLSVDTNTYLTDAPSDGTTYGRLNGSWSAVVSADEKVKYAADDTSAGYLGAKTVAGTGITLAEGTGGDADKLKISTSFNISDYLTTSTAASTYLKLDASNDPLTGELKLRTGSATAGTAPLKFTSGTLLTAAEAGAIEFLTDDFYGTITTGAARKKFILDDGTSLTSGRVPFATTNGRLTDDADFTFATDTLTVTKIIGTTSITDSALTAGRVTFAGTAGVLSDSANLTYNSGTGAMTVAAGAAQNLMGTGLHINTAGGSTAGYDTQIEGDTDANLLYVDASADKVGVGVATPSAKLHIISTTEQLRVGYDASNYKSETVNSTGSITTDLVGTSPINIFSQAVKFSGGTQSSDGSAGLSATYNFDATTSGNITSMTFKNGLLTAVTTLP